MPIYFNDNLLKWKISNLNDKIFKNIKILSSLEIVKFKEKILTVAEWEGNTLEMTRISRLDMGAYLCIASNGIPPTVSKQIKVSVDCEYQ